MKPLIPLALLVLAACRDDTVRRRDEPPPVAEPRCGDGKIDSGEDCDLSDLAAQTCVTLGFDQGTLSCDAQCRFSTVACLKKCGNGALDPGEACDGTLGPLGCSTWGYRTCAANCSLDSSHCVGQPLVSGPAVAQPKGGPAVVANLSLDGLGDLIAGVPAYFRLETFKYTTQQGFVADRRLNPQEFNRAPSLPVAADLDGDGRLDLAAVNLDGTVNRYLFNGSAFPSQAVPATDAGPSCQVLGWVGAGRVDADAGDDLVALGCPSGSPPRANAFLVYKGGPSASPPLRVPATGIVAAALADQNQDGLLDIWYVAETALELRVLQSSPPSFAPGPVIPLPSALRAMALADLDGDLDLDLAAFDGAVIALLENTGTSLAPRPSISTTEAFGLAALDLDLDGRPDLAWLADGKLNLRRSLGAFQFASYEAQGSTARAVSLSIGDVDLDGDLDFAATYALEADPAGAHSTVVLLNRAH